MGFNKIGWMKFFIAMVCGLVLAGCPTDSDDNNKIIPDSKVVETRLRGIWNIASSVGQTPTNVAYEFGERTYKYNNTTMNVYTRGDAIYDTLSGSQLMTYVFFPQNEFDDEYANAEQSGDTAQIYRWGIWKNAAHNGLAVKFTTTGG